MASDTELQQHSSTDNIKATLEANAQTIHSFSEQTAVEQDTLQANTALPRPVDDDGDEDEEKSLSLAEVLLKFFSKTTPFARAGRYMLCAIFLGILGTLLWFLDPNMSFIQIPTVPSILLCAALVMFGYGFTLMIIHSFVVFAHRRNSLYNSRALNWLTEFEEYIAASILFSMFVILFANLDAYGSVPKPFSLREDPWHYLTRVVLLGSQSASIYVHFGIISLVMVVLAAVKRHFMHKMAIEFNYSNYCDRVEECLFVERMLQALMKSKQAYRFRKKWKSFMNESTPRKRNVAGNQSTIARSEFVEVHLDNQLDLKNFSDNRTTSPSSTSPSSPQFAPINSPNSGKNVQTSTTPHASSASSSNVKREQFEEFAHLANRTAAQFDSLTVTDIRVEIHREARRLASQLFKWLVNPLKGNFSAAEMEPFIENSEDLNRFISLLRKQKKVNIEDSAVFTEGDLRRAIDISLQERYGLAKSMETIEMALGKIDSILDCVLFIFGAALMSVYIFKTANTTLITLSSIFVPATVIFESAVKSIVESIIFLLVIHPFDIGDRVFLKLDTSDGKVGADAMDNLVVVEMNLMSTVFERWDGVCVYVANSVLAQKVIYNIRRSGSTLDVLKMSFGHDTSLEQLEQLRASLLSFLRQNRQDFTEFLRVNVDSLDRINLMNVTILVQHVGNWQDLELQMTRRTKTLTFIKATVEELGIHYELPKQRVELLEHSPINIDRSVNL